MHAQICVGCDYLRPWLREVHGGDCSAFGECVMENACGLRTPSLPRDENGRQILPEQNKDMEGV